MKLSKVELRQLLLEKRKRFFLDSKTDYLSLNNAILKNTTEFLSQKSIEYCAGFKSIHGEPDLISLTDQNKSIKLAYPLIEGNHLTFILNGKFNLNNFGLSQPMKGTGEEISLNQLNLIFVPGIGFDLSGNRIGYGKGYYDRALSNCSKDLIKVGICFEFQICEQVDVEINDIAMDFLITNKRILECKKV